jgi:predicted membrane chloride channel (bestrophin family)
MMIRKPPSRPKLFLLLRASIMPRILPILVVIIVIAMLVTMAHGDSWDTRITLATVPFALVGLPIALFPAYRNNPPATVAWARATRRRTRPAAQSTSTRTAPHCMTTIVPPPLKTVDYCLTLR